MKIRVEHHDGEAIARFEFLYQAEIFAAALGRYHPEYVLCVHDNDFLMSQWQNGVGTGSDGKPIKIVKGKARR